MTEAAGRWKRMNATVWRRTDRSTRVRYLDRPDNARKLRLFAAACCRRVWDRFPDERSRAAIELAERQADKHADEEELRQAAREAEAAWYEAGAVYRSASARRPGSLEGGAFPAASEATYHAARAAVCYLAGGWNDAAEHAVFAATFLVPRGSRGSPGWARAFLAAARQERRAQKALLDEVFGDPFAGPLVAAPAWLAWDGGAVGRLARAAYQDRILPLGTLNSARLGVLADALEEAGCTHADLLGHLRGPGPHVLGCWALDAVLGKS